MNHSICLSRAYFKGMDMQEERDAVETIITLLNDICAAPCKTTIIIDSEWTDEFIFTIDCGYEHINNFLDAVQDEFPDIEEYMEVKKYEPEGA